MAKEHPKREDKKARKPDAAGKKVPKYMREIDNKPSQPQQAGKVK